MSDDLPTSSPPPSPNPSPPRQDSEERTVPMDRFRAVVEAKNASLQLVQELREEVQKHAERAALADSLAKSLEEGRAGWKLKEMSYQEDLVLLSSGLTDEDGRAVARALYNRLPPEGKPKTMGEWIGSLREEGATLPKALAPYLAPSIPTVPPTRPHSSPTGNPVAPRPGAQPPLAPQVVTPEALTSATEQFKQGRISADDLRAMLMLAKNPT